MIEQLKYKTFIFWSEEDGGYIANVPALKYCSAFGETYEEALQEIQTAIALHLEVIEEMGRPIPEPESTSHEELNPLPKAAEKFAEAVRESYRTVVNRGELAQQLNAELTQQFYNAVINKLRSQADEFQESSLELHEQQERQQQAAQLFTQESVGTYMDFMNAMFSFYQESFGQAAPQGAERGTGRD